MDEIAVRQFLTQMDAVHELPREEQLDALRLIIATHQEACLAFWGEMFATVREECQDFDKVMSALHKLVSSAAAPTHMN